MKIKRWIMVLLIGLIVFVVITFLVLPPIAKSYLEKEQQRVAHLDNSTCRVKRVFTKSFRGRNQISTLKDNREYHFVVLQKITDAK